MRHSSPLVTLIIPIYNAENYLSSCVDSVLSQTYKNLEIILVDDGSTDKSAQICNDYATNDERIKIVNKKNAGVASARNFGLKKAIGEYIMFVDSDDILDRRCVENCVDIAISKKVDMVKFSYKKKLGFIKRVYKYNTPTNCVIKKGDFADKVFQKIFCSYDFTNVWTMMIKSEIAKNISFKNYLCGEDFLYSVECITESNGIYIIDEPLYEYTINWASLTHVFDLTKLTDELAVLNKVAKIAKSTESLDVRIKNSIYTNLVNCAIAYSYEDYKKHLEGVPLDKFVDKKKVLSKSFYYKMRIFNLHKVVLTRSRR